MMAFLMGLKTVSPAELYQSMRERPVAIFDVNAEFSWRRARVPTARHLDPVAFTEADLPTDKSSLLVFYCSNLFCRKAPTAARRAVQLGYQQVRVMSAGISGWLDARLPVESSEASDL